MIPYGRQEITQDDIDMVSNVLTSDFLTQGPMVPRFEQSVCDLTGAHFATAVNSATSALHLACVALGLQQGDWLWTSPNTFVASANCALYCGAKVDFVDIDVDTFNICPDALEQKLIQAQLKGTLPKVVVPVHFGGQPCDMIRIKRLGDQYGFTIIEDASHAIGACYENAPVGSCSYSDITVFSFHPVKIITSGEGGMATTNDETLDQKMKLLRSHGITRDPVLMTQVSDGPWYYQQVDLGWNYRMTDIHAALGLSQMTRLEAYIVRRHLIADRYDEAFKTGLVKSPLRQVDRYSALHLYVVQVDPSHSHKDIFTHLREVGIGVNLHYIPVHLQPYYRRFGFSEGDFPHAEKYYHRAISLPIYPNLSSSQQDQVITAVQEATRG